LAFFLLGTSIPMSVGVIAVAAMLAGVPAAHAWHGIRHCLEGRPT